jgi:pyruvate dehydrogenase E2 component (dihydrolipoamide acetyltransferase)
MKLRELFNGAGKAGAVKLSVNDFIVKAVSLALTDVPEANSAWMGDFIRQCVRPLDFSAAHPD